MPQKTDLSKEVYIFSQNNLIIEKKPFEKYHAIIEKKCSEHRAALNIKSKKFDEIQNNLVDHILELQKNIYELFKKHSLCITNVDPDLIEKDDHMLLFHIYRQPILRYDDPDTYFIPLAFISDEPNEEVSQKFDLLFQSYEHLNYRNAKRNIENPEKLDDVFSKQQIIDCLNQKDIIELKINLSGWLHHPILCGKAIWKLTKRETPLSKEEKKLIILEKIEKEKRKFERLKLKHEGTKTKRERISEDVKMFVWRRDQGKCVDCGSQEKLEFDHIIPVSKGGGNTARNLQLLCENCNRTKSAKI